jgi:hypothetical protein
MKGEIPATKDQQSREQRLTRCSTRLTPVNSTVFSDQFLARNDEILAGEEFPDENKYYTDQPQRGDRTKDLFAAASSQPRR